MRNAVSQQLLFAGRCAAQHMAGDLAAVAGMADAQAQAVKIVLVAEPGNDVLEAVMTTMTATLLDFAGAWRQVQLVVHHQNFITGNAEKIGQGRNCLTTKIHVGTWNQQADFLSLVVAPCGAAKEFFFFNQLALPGRCQLFHKKSPGIVPGLLVLRAWVAKTNDQSYCTHTGAPTGQETELLCCF